MLYYTWHDIDVILIRQERIRPMEDVVEYIYRHDCGVTSSPIFQGLTLLEYCETSEMTFSPS